MFNGFALVAVKDDQLRKKLVELLGINNFEIRDCNNLHGTLSALYKGKFNLVIADSQITESENLFSSTIIRNTNKLQPNAKTILLSSVEINLTTHNIPADEFILNDETLTPIENALIKLFGLNAVELYRTEFA